MPKLLARAILFLLALCGPCGLVAAAEPKTWEFRDGRWPEVSGGQPATTRPASDPLLVRAEQLIRDRQYSLARKRLASWFKTNRGHPLYDRALYLMAEALYGYGDRIRSFFYLDQLMDEHPESRLFYTALERQFQIADDFLNGYKSRFLGMPIIGREDEAIEMLYRIQQRSPGSPLAERALLRTADFYYADAQYDLAADAYGAYAKAYPRSPALPRVRLRQAFSNLAQFRGLRFDATPVIDARTQLLDLMAAFPDVAEEENLAEIVQRIDTSFARKLYYRADFYRRTHEPVAAVYTYRYLIRTYPQSEEAQLAEQALKDMPRSALETPPPGRGLFSPPGTTQPVSYAN